jgi:hypothetical protein
LSGERAQLWEFVRYSALAISFWRFRQFVVRHPDESSEAKRESYKEMRDRASQVADAQARCVRYAAPP